MPHVPARLYILLDANQSRQAVNRKGLYIVNIRSQVTNSVLVVECRWWCIGYSLYWLGWRLTPTV